LAKLVPGQKQQIFDTFWEMIDNDIAKGQLETSLMTKEAREKSLIEIKSTGGLSNTVVIVGAVDDPKATVVYRFITSEAGNHEIEAKLVYVLADEGIIPGVLGQTSDYRVDHFITGKVIQRTQAIEYGPMISKAVSRVHNMGENCTQYFKTPMIE